VEGKITNYKLRVTGAGFTPLAQRGFRLNTQNP
jgi:hypothetical protein